MEKQSVTIVRGSVAEGTTDTETGLFTPAAGASGVVWGGRGIYLDQGPMDRLVTEGAPEYVANGSVYLPKGVIESSGVEEGDSLVIVYRNGNRIDASVAKVIRYKRRLDVRRA